MLNAHFFKDKLFKINAQNFEKHALSLFRWQAVHNAVYRAYLNNLSRNTNAVNKLEDIPFLPISFFKNHRVMSGDQENQQWTYFESSGTTGQQRSRHYVSDPQFYVKVCQQIFEQQYGPLEEYHIFALLPSYLERQNASLVAMTDDFIRKSRSTLSGFFLDNYPTLLKHISEARNSKRKILLLGVTFALLELAENCDADLEGVVIMETGGMKGRRKEIVRQELHQYLAKQLNVLQIHAEYGMTELMSQAYAKADGIFRTPPWMRIYIRDINDPFYLDHHLRYGGINIIDLANVDSCAFIETQDLGRYHTEDQTFEVLGRLDNTDVRGCNLMVAL